MSWLKFYNSISREAMGAAIDEAHKKGIKTTGHIGSVTFREAVALGIDNIEHGLLTIAVADPAVAARELLPIVGGAGLAVISVARARPTLEDVFLRLTAGGSAAA